MKYIIKLLIILIVFVCSIQINAQKSDSGEMKGENMIANAVFKIENWEETVFSEVKNGGKLARVSISKTYSGDIEGEGKLEYLMRYREDGYAEFYGLERVIGRIGNRSGSFVFRHNGTFKEGKMTQQSVILEESGTGDLINLQGETTLTAGHQQEYPFVLHYKFE